MAVAAAETEILERPPVILVPEMAQDRLDQQRADRVIALAGRLAVDTEVRQVPIDQPYSLKGGIERAAEGDPTGRQLVEANVGSDVMERSFKAGHVIEIEVGQNERGKLQQHGQELEEVQVNSLMYASAGDKMTRRTQAETRNAMRQETLYRLGMLDDHYLVTVSLADDEMTQEELEENHFFTDTMSGVIQAVTAAGDQGIELDSAFVAGIKKPGQERHDKQTVVKMAAGLGVDYGGLSATEIIDRPMLIHKSLMPNGVIDLVKLYDQAAGGTFFGEAKPAQDYLEYLEVCRRRTESFKDTVKNITDQLISEAGSFLTPRDATNRLHELSQQYLVERAVTDHSINPRVFGAEAAGHIEAARYHRQMGNIEQARAFETLAQATAKSTSCPTGNPVLREQMKLDQNPEAQPNPEAQEDNKGTIRCIQCREYVPKAQVVKKDCWECPKCAYKIDICTGAVLNKGVKPKRQAFPGLAEVLLLDEKRAAKKAVPSNTIINYAA